MTTATDRRPIRMNPKVLGTIGMIAAPMMLVEVLSHSHIGLRDFEEGFTSLESQVRRKRRRALSR